jgi:hypothetical protein
VSVGVGIAAITCPKCDGSLIESGNQVRCSCCDWIAPPMDQNFTSAEMPLYAKTPSWPAFFFAPIWFCTLGVWDWGIFTCVLWGSGYLLREDSVVGGVIRLLSLASSFYFKAKGNEIAYKHGAFRDIKHFLDVKRTWTIRVWILLIGLAIILWEIATGQIPLDWIL